MFIISKRNLVIPSDDGSQRLTLAKDYIGPVPDWVAQTRYFKALVKDGKIILSRTPSDKELLAGLEATQETPVEEETIREDSTSPESTQPPEEQPPKEQPPEEEKPEKRKGRK